MYTATLPFHGMDPILVSIGPLAIRWYSLAYIFGLLVAWWVAKRLVRANPAGDLSETDIDDLIGLCAIGVIGGGRLGYVLFYNLPFYLQNPLAIFRLWDGGMSFHGGVIGVAIAFTAFAILKKKNFFALGDVVVSVVGFGMLFGRLANFINGELFGRASNLPWAMEFPGAIGARHPSQLYEALLGGVLVTTLCLWLMAKPNVRAHAGFVGGVFLVAYGAVRIFVEFFRQPDAHIGFIGGWLTLGMILSVPMIALGLFFMVRARLAPPVKVTGYNA